MADAGQAAEIRALLERLSEAMARRRAAAEETRNLSEMNGAIREAFGRPFYYSGAKHGRPENADKSSATYTGSASHDVVLPTILRFKEANREVTVLREKLRELGYAVEPDRL